MSSLEEFESTLKDIVNAKRLSARKMNSLTEIALKSMKDDTQLVSILYRTHKALPSAAKISSLYVFDALSRAARNQVIKQGHTTDPKSGEGNSATFLLKVEGVLEGLFVDMVSLNTPEAKEKTQKILDIWIKGNTFPSTILSRLKDVLVKADEGKKDSEVNQPAPVNVPAQTAQPLTTAGNTIPDPQAALLALLAQAASARNGVQIHPNTPAQPTQQLALLQQLAQATKGGDGTLAQPSTLAPPEHRPSNRTNVPFEGSPSRSPPSYREPDYNVNRRPARYDSYDEPDRGHDFNEYHRNNYAGPSRGFRSYRGRGRGDIRGRWDDRDRVRDRERSPPRRMRRSRSRSPPGRFGGGRRDTRPYSPPRRPSNASSIGHAPTGVSAQNPNEPEKDEFGRDIRPQSPTRSETASAPAEVHQNPETLSSKPSVEPSAPLSPNNQSSASSSVATNLSSETAALADSTTQPQFSLDQFDYTNPASWEALGERWQMAYGYAPSTEEIMQYVMTGGMMPNQMGGGMQGWSNDSWGESASSYNDGNWRGGRGRGGFTRGRGGYGHGNPRDTQGPVRQDEMDTDAIVLGEDTNLQAIGDPRGQDQVQRQPVDTGGGGGGGKMQRVGDKWIFVRDTAAAGS